jgi:hypothetical protein
MKDFMDKDIMARIIAEIIVADIMATTPADSAEKTQKHTEKPIAWIELHEDDIDKAYEMSKEYREYE